MLQIFCFSEEMNAAIVGGLISSVVSIIGFFLVIKQIGISKRNQIESTFFNLLNYYREVYNSTSGTISRKSKNHFDQIEIIGEFKKSDFFNQLYNLLENEYLIDENLETLFLLKKKDYKGILEIHKKKYKIFYSNYVSQLELFFGSLINLATFVDEKIKNKEDKINYTNFIRNQLGDYELIILFYHFKLSSDKKFISKIDKMPLFFDNLKTERVQYYICY